MKQVVGVLVAAAVTVLSFAGASASRPEPGSPSGTVLKGVADIAQVAQLTGPGSMNETDTRWQIMGADLGHAFSMDNRLYLVFGDCYGAGFVPPPTPASDAFDRRGNTLAVVADRTPADGLTFERMITDAPGHAKELIPYVRDPKVLKEAALIPTQGLAVGSRMYLHYMSVRTWDGPGRWTLNHSGIAYSDDRGEHWTKPSRLQWPGTSEFGQVAYVRSGRTVYVFGIPGGRFGDVRLARVPQKQLLNPDAYRFYGGTTGRKVRWVESEGEAQVVAKGPAGELSVLWNPFLRRWIMTYLDEPARALVIREAPQLWGPWSAPLTLAAGKQYPGLYGAYLHPWLTERNGEVVYFLMSRWPEYNVYLMRARLVK